MNNDNAERAAKVLNVALHRAQGEVVAAVWQAAAMLEGGVGTADVLLDAIRQHVVGDGQRVGIVANAVSALACDKRHEEMAGAMLVEAVAKASQLVDKGEMAALELLAPGWRKLAPGEEVPQAVQDMLEDLQTITASRLVSRFGSIPRRFTDWELVALVERTLGE